MDLDYKSVYMVSKYSSPNRGHARHVIGDDDKPLCGKKLTKTGSWQYDSSEPDCKKCLKKQAQIKPSIMDE